MRPTRYSSCLCVVLFAVAGCAEIEDEPEDLGTLSDDKSDTTLPRTVEIELEPGESKRYRIATAAFVASVAQDGDALAQLTAKHYDLEFESDVSIAPRLDAIGDGTVRNWTLTLYNRGDSTLDATIAIDVPRDSSELGIVSDIDKTVMPPETDAVMPPPYPGIASLLTTFELRAQGRAGDVHFVTARTPDKVVEIPAWMAMHDVPAGSIDTGISGVPWVAQAEKVRDISRIFDTRVQQKFVLLGDTSHRDPEVYAEILTKYPDRVLSIFIHKVNTTVPPARVEGMHLVDNYAEAAAIAFGEDLLTEAEARATMTEAQSQGLAITDAEIDALIEAAR
ncbi:MAG TPA: phosphatase domain-containing protein [Kofleriaceae bacterium]